jgi:hypothetical protein
MEQVLQLAYWKCNDFGINLYRLWSFPLFPLLRRNDSGEKRIYCCLKVPRLGIMWLCSVKFCLLHRNGEHGARYVTEPSHFWEPPPSPPSMGQRVSVTRPGTLLHIRPCFNYKSIPFLPRSPTPFDGSH